MQINVKTDESTENETEQQTAIDFAHHTTYRGIYSFKTPQGFEFFIDHHHHVETSSYIDNEDNRVKPGSHFSEGEYFNAYTDVKEPLIVLSHAEMKEYFNNYFDKSNDEKYEHPNYPKFSQYAEQVERGRNLEIRDLHFDDEDVLKLISDTIKALQGRKSGLIDIELPNDIEQKIIKVQQENLKESSENLNNQVLHAQESVAHFLEKSANEAIQEIKRPKPKP